MADILIIDDQDRTFELCRRGLPENRYRGPARCWRDASEQLARARGRVDLVLLDVHFDIDEQDLEGFQEGMTRAEVEKLKRRQGLHILERLRLRYPDLPVIVMTAAQDVRLEEAALGKRIEEYTYFLNDDEMDAPVESPTNLMSTIKTRTSTVNEKSESAVVAEKTEVTKNLRDLMKRQREMGSFDD